MFRYSAKSLKIKASLAEIFAFTGSLCILFSLTYEIGFYDGLNEFDFFKLLSLQDHIIASLRWIVFGVPFFVLLYFLFVLAIWYFTKKNTTYQKYILSFCFCLGFAAQAYFTYGDLKGFDRNLFIFIFVAISIFAWPAIFNFFYIFFDRKLFDSFVFTLILPVACASYNSGYTESSIKRSICLEMHLPFKILIASSDKGAIFLNSKCTLELVGWDKLEKLNKVIKE